MEKKGRMLNIGFFCAGLMFVSFALIIFLIDINYTNKCTSKTDAIVTGLFSKEEEVNDYDYDRPHRNITTTKYYANIKYLGYKTGKVSISKDQYNVGDIITIMYNPYNTDMFRIKNDKNYGKVIFIGIMLVMSIPLFVCSVIFRNVKKDN